MKKIVSLIIMCLVISLSFNVFASYVDPEITDVAPEGMYNKYLTPYNENGSDVSIQSILNISLPVVQLNQHDSRWGEDIMQTCGTSISSQGCALTCTAMVFKYFGTETNPGMLNEDIGNYACPINWSKAAELGSHGKARLATYRQYPSGDDVINATINALRDDTPVIIGFIKPNGGTHFVLVKSVIGDGLTWDNYGVVDPNGGVKTNLEYFIDMGWDFYRLVILNANNIIYYVLDNGIMGTDVHLFS